MTVKDFVTERTNVFYQAWFELNEKVHECRGKSIDEVPETIYVRFDNGRYSIGCYHLNGWSLWDDSDDDNYYWQLGTGSFNDMTDMLYAFIQHCYSNDERFTELEF